MNRLSPAERFAPAVTMVSKNAKSKPLIYSICHRFRLLCLPDPFLPPDVQPELATEIEDLFEPGGFIVSRVAVSARRRKSRSN